MKQGPNNADVKMISNNILEDMHQIAASKKKHQI